MDLEDISTVVVGIFMLIAIRSAFVFFESDEAEGPVETAVGIAVEEKDTPAENFYSYEDLDLVEVDGLEKIKSIADSVGYPWAENGGRFMFGCPDGADCFCGSSCLLGEMRWREGSGKFYLWITENAFANETILKFTVFHEMAHLWQVNTRGYEDQYEDFSQWDFGEVDPMEATADCLASAWGGEGYIYYDCPLDAQRYIHQIYLESLR